MGKVGRARVLCADSRELSQHLPPHSIDAIVTSPPYYGLRDYDVPGQVGQESSPMEYVESLAGILTDLGENVLRPGGSLWLNIGDTYSSGGRGGTKVPPDSTMGNRTGNYVRHNSDFPGKSLLMMPERVSLLLIQQGWRLRNKVVWAKPSGTPTQAKDRLMTRWEHVLHFTRQTKYFYDLDAIKAVEDGRHPTDVWTIPAQPYRGAHFAVFPPDLVLRPILATVPIDGMVLDPFAGAGTTLLVANRLDRRSIGVDLNRRYCEMMVERLEQDQP